MDTKMKKRDWVALGGIFIILIISIIMIFSMTIKDKKIIDKQIINKTK